MSYRSLEIQINKIKNMHRNMKNVCTRSASIQLLQFNCRELFIAVDGARAQATVKEHCGTVQHLLNLNKGCGPCALFNSSKKQTNKGIQSVLSVIGADTALPLSNPKQVYEDFWVFLFKLENCLNTLVHDQIPPKLMPFPSVSSALYCTT